MVQNQFKIEGMTCQSCVDKVNRRVQSLPHVSKVEVNLENKLIHIESHHGIKSQLVKDVLHDMPKYSISEINESKPNKKINISKANESVFKTYKPLIVVLSFIFLISLSIQVNSGVFDKHQFMNYIMSGFFIGFSLFKFLDLKSFAESFSSYDPIAQKYLSYGLIYPFIEFSLGIMYLNHFELFVANMVTIFILTITTIGVIKRLQSKSTFRCACLGTAFSLPLSYVTVVENAFMVSTAIYGMFFESKM